MALLLAIDDDESYLASLSGYLKLKGHSIETLVTPPPAVTISGQYDLVLLDIMLGALDGFDTLDEYTAEGIPVVMVSGVLDVQAAVRAIRAGALDVLEKPLDADRLELVIAMAQNRLKAERTQRAARNSWLHDNFFVGDGSLMKVLVASAERIASSALSVLVHGPSGCGKEPLARWIHFRSPRCEKPFVAINCAAISAELAESEFFGHRKGSFTGADRERLGCFREAGGGTLFLDEIGELSLALQAKLLRVLETSEVRPVGSDAAVAVNVRLICATNRDLRAEAAKGTFREDLLYRLAQVPLSVPPLSERKEDIPGLVQYFLERAKRNGADRETAFDAGAGEYLAKRNYPGNIRELKNLVERAAALSGEASISASFLSGMENAGWSAQESSSPLGDASPRGDASSGIPARADPCYDAMPLREAKRRFELLYLERQIQMAGGSLARAAEKLNLLPNNLSRRLAELRRGN